MEAYRDRWITCDDDEIRIRAYYFPWGTKRIPYGSIRDLRRVAMDVLHGRGRIWGTGNFGYWASLDPKRPSKSIAFILDIGRHVRPFLTPDDPDAFERAVRGHVSMASRGRPRTRPSSGRSPSCSRGVGDHDHARWRTGAVGHREPCGKRTFRLWNGGWGHACSVPVGARRRPEGDGAPGRLPRHREEHGGGTTSHLPGQLQARRAPNGSRASPPTGATDADA